ncbi:MAG TPA: sugar phosphate isomerase/epimerase [Nocardioides sp.]|jgi:sugar phosphate isomerase/epimerase|uniref:sugar phosphate isomerase/epimerase family protein n=1 Tax=Nocardioides sp. TaxID=35761 RepID=UPI002E36A5DE|nr:sugar phosphate isomerase/epimerase [Nocardioides sp.]HEX3931795.1 sugar phosphate isomerase/epimerase [Nocardioides sp.]
MTAIGSRVAYLVGSPECHVVPELAYQAPLDESLAALRELGYDGVEIQVRDPADPRCADLGGRCRQAGLEVAALGTGPVGAQDELTLTALDDATRARALERLRRIVAMAGEIGCPVTLGRSRGSLTPGHEDVQRGWFVAAVTELSEQAATGGQQLLLEPQCLGDLLRTTPEVVELLGDPAGWPPGLGIVLDSWHADQAGDDWTTAWRLAGSRIRYVQLAGPDRGPVVEGAELASLLDVAAEHEYAGWLCAEHRQVGTSESAARTSLWTLRAGARSEVTGPGR